MPHVPDARVDSGTFHDVNALQASSHALSVLVHYLEVSCIGSAWGIHKCGNTFPP
jgi:hypothetical protein